MTAYQMPFGKYRSVSVQDIPASYLGWLLRTCKLSSGLRAAVREELMRRGADPASLPPELPAHRPARCRQCGGADLRLYWQQLGGAGGRTIRADCKRCHCFVSFVAQTLANVAKADEATSKTGLLDVLTRAEAEGVEIVRHPDGRLSLSPHGWASEELQALVRQNTRLLLAMLPGPSGAMPEATADG